MTRYTQLNKKQTDELNDIIHNGESTGREVRRAQAIFLLNNGSSVETITAVTKYRRRRMYALRQRYLKEGIIVIKDKRKGKPKELLTKKQHNEIARALNSSTPKDHGYEYDYWTTGILGDFIEHTYGVTYKSKTSYYIVFREARFTYHKPGRVYERRNEQEVQEWRIQVKKQVEAVWNKTHTIVLTEDEMHLSTQTTVQKIWLPQGKYPKIEVSKKRESRSIYGFLNIKTGQEHAFKTKWQNMYITKDVLGELRKIYPTEKLFLLWDKAGWHKGSEAQKFIKADGKIETIYFPASAPEENPQEHVWKNGRERVTHNHFIRDIDKATDEFVDYLNATQFPYVLLGFSACS